MKLYIAGQITGLEYDAAFAKFAAAEDLLRELGHEPVNPMRENGPDGDGNEYPWAEYMKRDIPHLLRCDGIYLLPCWKNSKGATFEKLIAETLDMDVHFHANAGIARSIL